MMLCQRQNQNHYDVLILVIVLSSVMMLMSSTIVHGFMILPQKPTTTTTIVSINRQTTTTTSNRRQNSHQLYAKSYKHLFRHYDDISMDCWLRCAEPYEFLKSCGYNDKEILDLSKEMPTLLEKNVYDHIAPHMRFLVHSMGGGIGDLQWTTSEMIPTDINLKMVEDEDEECTVHEEKEQTEETETEETHQLIVSDQTKKVLPALFFNLRLETTLGPRHAYLTWQQNTLPSGSTLLDDKDKLYGFLETCKSTKLDSFVELCNDWETDINKKHTKEDIQAFIDAFHQGLVPACRNALHTKTSCLPGIMVQLLLQHGANHLEDDHYGASLLHWAAGTGNQFGVQALLNASKHDGYSIPDTILNDHVAKDGATPLHWAAAGVSPTGVFGTGGKK